MMDAENNTTLETSDTSVTGAEQASGREAERDAERPTEGAAGRPAEGDAGRPEKVVAWRPVEGADARPAHAAARPVLGSIQLHSQKHMLVCLLMLLTP